jgi:hypothetical protein
MKSKVFGRDVSREQGGVFFIFRFLLSSRLYVLGMAMPSHTHTHTNSSTRSPVNPHASIKNTNRMVFSLYLCILLTGKGNDGDNTRKLCLTHVFFRQRNSVPLDNDQYFLEEAAPFFFFFFFFIFLFKVCIYDGEMMEF